MVEGACVTIKIVLSSPLRTLPQSLRDSSLSEGAFEKFAAVIMVLAVCFNGPPTRMEHSWAEHSGAGRTVPTKCKTNFGVKP